MDFEVKGSDPWVFKLSRQNSKYDARFILPFIPLIIGVDDLGLDGDLVTLTVRDEIAAIVFRSWLQSL